MHVMDLLSLKNKVALVTGGRGQYGQQILAALAEGGACTYVASRNVTALEEIAEEYRNRGYDVHALPLDLADEASIHHVRDAILERSGRLDVLVNNSVARVMAKGWDDSAEKFDESMHINATGLFLITRALGEVMRRQQSGSIINIGSMMGMVGIEQHNYEGTNIGGWPVDYFFHKGGMINFTRFCASYFGSVNVRVNCVSPGGLQTPDHPAKFVENYSKRTQLGRMAGPDDLKGIILLLASDASAYMTGANIPVDGGYTAK